MSNQRDVYANLLRDTRGLRRDQAGVRDAWYAALPWADKERSLFELEMLLKGFACFGNLRNHVGATAHQAAVAHDFRHELTIVRDGLAEAVANIRKLLGEGERAYTFNRYLETVLPEDTERAKLSQDQLAQDTPTESLFVLRNTFESFLEIAKALGRTGRVAHRTFYGLLNTITREIGRNVYFNPLVSLEFRSEFDRIHNAEVLEALHAMKHDAAHRVVALSFLTLLRALRYISLVDQWGSEPATARRTYLILAAFRSDLRTLSRFLTNQASDAIADGFEQEILAIPQARIGSSYAALSEAAEGLSSLRATLESVAHGVDIEVKRSFDRDLPAPGDTKDDAALGAQMVVATATLRATLHNAIDVLFTELAPTTSRPELASDDAARRATSERLRRDVWMFIHILRAFLAKAHAASSEESDQWKSLASFQFVREFLAHFRAIGFQLVRLSDYARLDHFLSALESLRDADLLDPNQLAHVIEECEGLYRYFEELFTNVSHRHELADVEFDKRSAVETLRIYLGAA